MKLFLLGQTDSLITNLFNDIFVRYGALFALLAIVGFMVFLTWRSSEDARIRQRQADNERMKEDTRRDSLINDYAAKYGQISEKVAEQGIILAKAEGKVDLLSNQLEAERERRQKEHEELKSVIRDLSEKLKSNEDKIAALQHELNGKLEEIKALRLERDLLHEQLKDKDMKVQSLERDIQDLKQQKNHLESKSNEQAAQIASLAKQLAELDAPKTASSEAPIVSESEKELSTKTNEEKAE